LSRRPHLSRLAGIEALDDRQRADSLAGNDGMTEGDPGVHRDDLGPFQASCGIHGEKPQGQPRNIAIDSPEMRVQELPENDLPGTPDIEELAQAFDEDGS